MKKALFIVAVATLFFSCQQEIEPSTPSANEKGITFTAVIDDNATKAEINSSNGLVWSQGDKLGIFVNDASWTDKNQPFTLEGAGGSATGTFIWDYGNFDNENATVAFFPWNGTGSTANNVYDGNVYFKLPESYSDYTSGQMLTPLVAELAYDTEAGKYETIMFKHAGAAVKVTINNVPPGVHSLGMKVDGQQIYGDYHVTPDNDTPGALALDGSADVSKNTIWLNIPATEAEGEFTFLFPVPEVTTPKLSFMMYDKNDVLVWKKNLKAQSSSLGRGDVLEMPAIDITPYAQFADVSAEWTVIGTANGTNWNADIPMMTDGTICIAKGVQFAAGGEFKIRKDKAWDTEAYPSENYVVTNAGTYDIIFDSSNGTIQAVETGCAYPEAPVNVGIDGDMSDWASVPGTILTPTSSAAIEQVKAYADDDYIYVYIKRAKIGSYKDVWGTNQGYYYFDFDLDNNPETGSNPENSNGNFEAWCYLYVFGNENEFVASPSGSGHGMTISHVECAGAVSDDAIEVEVAFPRNDLPEISANTVSVSVRGNKGASSSLINTSFTVKPIEINIAIDGDMSDWAKVPGATTTGIIKAFKMWNDDTNFYFYNSCAPGDRGRELWAGGGYYYYDFDLDNDATTGNEDYMDGSHGPFEAMICIFPFGGSEEAPAIELVKTYKENDISPTGISLDGVISDSLIEIEFVIPRANFTTQVNSGDIISVYNWRAKGGNSTTLTYTVK